jgi:type II secretory pathway component GspD/PulD (secretin)
VISGIFRRESSDIVRKVPIVGDIPLLGLLFTSIEKEHKDIELLVFITPVVVENDSDRERMNDPYQRRLEELRGSFPGQPPAAKPGETAPPVPPAKTPDDEPGSAQAAAEPGEKGS